MLLPILKKKKNKVFVSQAMQHATPDEVHKERDGIMSKLKQIYPEHEFELIEQYHVAEPAEWKDKTPRELRWARLARSIDMMSSADIIVFADSAMLSGIAPGCKAERTVATEYKNEYPDGEYHIINEWDLNKYIREKGLNPFYTNIMECVKYDTKMFVEYYEELINIVRRFIPLKSDPTVNDTENCWYVEYVELPWYICAELSKCCIVDEEDYDNGEFFRFVFEYGYGVDETSKIVIKSYNNGQTKGIKVDEYKLSPDKTIPIALFESLKEVCDYEA